jgi:thiamine-monophosphate kinase
MNYQEKQFIREVLGPIASTAAPDSFDDAVTIDLAELTGQPDAPFLVYSIDQPSFVRSADRNLDPFRYYGRWIAGTTCNDVIAMGGRCRGFSLALAAPLETETSDVQSLVLGITDVLERCGATYEGGNLDSGQLTTVGLAWGIVARHGIVRRGGAREGDMIVVTGELGLGWLEYQLRTHGLSDLIDPLDKEAFLRYKEMPIGAAAAVAAVADKGWFTSGMDLSDGLIEFLYTVQQRSSLGCVIDCAALPVSMAVQRNMPLLADIGKGLMDVLHGTPELIALEPGYDSPLRHAFTVSPAAVGAAQDVFLAHGASLHVIGEVTQESAVLLRRENSCTEIPAFWDDQLRQESPLTAWATFLQAFS